MNSIFLPVLDQNEINLLTNKDKKEELFDLFTQPLHEELYKQGNFEFIEQLSEGQQLFISWDYVCMQVGQGGFIQLIQNGYIGLLPTMVEQLYMMAINDMALVLDDVLKVFVLNQEQLSKNTSVEEFARLYDEFKEFELIEARFMEHKKQAMEMMLAYALNHLDEFCTVAGLN